MSGYHYFITQTPEMGSDEIHASLAILKRTVDLEITPCSFDEQPGHVITVQVEVEAGVKDLDKLRRFSVDLGNYLKFKTLPRPVFPPNYAKLKSEAFKTGDTLFCFPAVA